ncbi:integration host factor subunit beta [Treponema sp. OMZ 788]|uniref:HU family DNA-binding protein n=1 Tax=unclassified Treponema TaxID=2638727 RepID=UPI0020A448E9|nr:MULTISPECIES: HU family DNA-binding protein [unclassified Treponema]UTC61375.1 integration host factor subunit beta [Treponema sp. OMZ 787]UTC65631.1 integration host factor subunit beta [Treponema sp. OMZ 788]
MKKKHSKIDIIDSVYRNNPQYQLKQINSIANLFLDELSKLLKQGIPVEIRGLGSFDFTVLHGKKNARNPKTGESVLTSDRCKIRFKPGKELKDSLSKIEVKEFSGNEK